MTVSVRNYVHRSGRRQSRRLGFEQLEDRRMLATITVTSLADNLTVDGQVTLREAIRAAELNISVDGSTAGSGADTIQFAASLNGAVNLSIVDDTVAGATALLVTSEVTIRGNNSGVTIQRSTSIGTPEMRLFRVSAGGYLTLESLTLTGGAALGAAGTIVAPDGEDGRGGAILNQGSLVLRTSTLHSNRAAGGNAASGGKGGAGLGGAIYNDSGHVAIVNVTLSGNLADAGTGSTAGSRFGAGVYGRNGTLSISNSTITNNPAIAGRGVYVIGDGGSATVAVNSTIIGQAELSIDHSDFVATEDNGGTIQTSGVGNLIRRAVGFPGVFITDNPQLLALATNGGPTLTHALAEGSPALNQGVNPMNLATDQRGATFLRVSDGFADIGAFEQQVAGGPNPAGDFDRNGVVDTADYVLWRNTLDAVVSPFSGADGNGDGRVNAPDHDVYRANFGRTASAASAVEFIAVEDVVRAVISPASAPAVPTIVEFSPPAKSIADSPVAGTEPTPQRVDELSTKRSGPPPSPKKIASFFPVRSRNLLELALVRQTHAFGPSGWETTALFPSNSSESNGESNDQIVDALLADWPVVYRHAIA